MTHDDIMAVADRRAKLERDLRAEGAAEPVIDRLATDQTAAKMLAYERDVVGLLTGMFR